MLHIFIRRAKEPGLEKYLFENVLRKIKCDVTSM